MIQSGGAFSDDENINDPQVEHIYNEELHKEYDILIDCICMNRDHYYIDMSDEIIYNDETAFVLNNIIPKNDTIFYAIRNHEKSNPPQMFHYNDFPTPLQLEKHKFHKIILTIFDKKKFNYAKFIFYDNKLIIYTLGCTYTYNTIENKGDAINKQYDIFYQSEKIAQIKIFNDYFSHIKPAEY